uniref:cytochrome c oxidase subunit II n=1 Tax=Mastax latefasciata TaxID=2962404 RepID=UPI002115577C|nr:cytochrome c oxidase subunit II [Mastax latefasciata]UTD45008.1 cytochrome c oxidase subunit 2 [Mastax latefasciata]
MATWSMFNLQDSNSPLMEQLMFFHDHSLMILGMITILVAYTMIMIIMNKNINRFLLEGQMIETVWTILPAIILLFLAFPSLRLLYLLEEIYKPLITLKSIGHQWYWSYEYSDFNKIEFDSYMMPLENSDSFRLLDVDNRVILPSHIQIRIIVTSLDVIHSWTIPSLGVKIDATPGRLNQAGFFMNRMGLFFGQCSEICGANHSFMPIVIETIPLNWFIKWIKNY